MSKLGDFLSIKHGWAFKGEFFSDKGTQSILTPGNFFEKGGFKENGGKERYYTGTYPIEYLCKKGDLIVAMTEQAEGLLGSTAIVPDDNMYLHNQRIGLINCKESELTKMYAYYLFMTKTVREQIGRSSTGTKVKHTSPEKIYDVVVQLLDVATQKKVSYMLWVFDQKIHNNKKIISELEDMTKTVYMHYFFRKQSNGVLGQIICENSKSTIQVGEAKGRKGQYPFFTSGEAIYEYDTALIDGRNCFLNTGGNADVKFYVGKSAYSTDTWCITGKNDMADYLYSLLHTIKLELNLKYFQGTGLKHLQKELLRERAVYIPCDEELQEFNRIVVPAFNAISEKTRENQQLTELRDWLLPMLMNGQATVE